MNDKATTLNKFKKIAAIIFVTIELILFITFIIMDSAGKESTLVKYSGVILCVITAGVSIAFDGKTGALLLAAMAFTAIADYFLLITGSDYEIGLLAFIAAQALHATRLHLARSKVSVPFVIVRLAAPISVIIVLAALEFLDLLTALVVVYFCSLVLNAVKSGLMIKNKAMLLTFIGFILFICCDVCVGLFNLPSVLGITLPAALHSFAATAMWIFYIPSQVAIVLAASL